MEDALRKRLQLAQDLGMSPEEQNKFLVQQSSILGRQQAAQPTPKAETKGRGGFLSSLIGEAGGLGGALAGGAAGAAAGSVVPVVGTAIGGILGAGLGAFAGGTGGSAVEQKVRDDNVDWGKAARFGAVEGATSAFQPIRAFKAVKALNAAKGSAPIVEDVAKGLPGVIGKSEDVSRTSLKGRADDVSNKLLTSQYGTISKPVSRANNPEATFGQLADMGITKPQDVERIAGEITGADGIITKLVASAVGGAKRLDTSNIQQVFDDALRNNGVVGADKKSAEAIFSGQLERMRGGAAPAIDGSAHPLDALESIRGLESHARDLLGRGETYHLPTSKDKAQARALLLARDEIEDRLYQAAGADLNVANVLTPDVRNHLLSLQPNNSQWQKFVDDQVMRAPGVAELRSTMAPFVRASKIIDEADLNTMTFGGRAGNAAGSPLLSMLEPVTGLASMAVQGAKGPIARVSSATVKRGGDLLGSMNNPPASLGSGGIATRALVGAGGASLLERMNYGQPAGLAQSTPSQGLASANPQSLLNPNMSAGSPQDLMGGKASSQAQAYYNASQLAMRAGDLKSAQSLMKFASQAQELESAMTPGSELSANQQKSVLNMQNAVSQVDQLKQLYDQSGGGQGRIGGQVAGLIGKVGGNAEVQAYRQKRAGAAAQVARALGESGTMTDEDVKRAVDQIPDITDTPQEAQIKWSSIQQILNQIGQNALLAPSASSS